MAPMNKVWVILNVYFLKAISANGFVAFVNLIWASFIRQTQPTPGWCNITTHMHRALRSHPVNCINNKARFWGRHLLTLFLWLDMIIPCYRAPRNALRPINESMIHNISPPRLQLWQLKWSLQCPMKEHTGPNKSIPDQINKSEHTGNVKGLYWVCPRILLLRFLQRSRFITRLILQPYTLGQIHHQQTPQPYTVISF